MRGGCGVVFAVAFVVTFLGGGIGLVSQGGGVNLSVGSCFIVCAVLAILLVVFARGTDLRTHGLRGEAWVLDAEETGLQINDRPVVRLRLRVQGLGIAPFETERKPVVPMTGLGLLSTGTPLTVWFDPEDHSKFDIDWSIPPSAEQGAQAPAGRDLSSADRLRQLDELHAAGLISADEYAAQRSRILGEL